MKEKRVPRTVTEIDTPLPVGFSLEFLETVRNLIAYFVLRQQLVQVAMLTFNPRVMQDVTGVDVAPYVEIRYQEFLENRRIIDEQGKLPHRPLPIWKNDWECFAHGHGCRLIHLRTGERIEWDAPDPKTFNPHWFINHLKWRLENELDDPYVQMCDDWMKTQIADIEVIEKAINCLIDVGILVIWQNHSCKLVDDIVPPASPMIQPPAEVITAFHNSLMHYHQRQMIVIEAMVDLRPDFIVQVAQDPYTMPDVAQRLEKLYRHLEHLPELGRKIQMGKWRDIWDYNIRHATCVLTHPQTQETLRWSCSDPVLIDYHGYTQHFLWRVNTNRVDEHIQTMHQWMKQSGEDVVYVTGRLIYLLTDVNLMTLLRNEKGLLIRWNGLQES